MNAGSHATRASRHRGRGSARKKRFIVVGCVAVLVIGAAAVSIGAVVDSRTRQLTVSATEYFNSVESARQKLADETGLASQQMGEEQIAWVTTYQPVYSVVTSDRRAFPVDDSPVLAEAEASLASVLDEYGEWLNTNLTSDALLDPETLTFTGRQPAEVAAEAANGTLNVPIDFPDGTDSSALPVADRDAFIREYLAGDRDELQADVRRLVQVNGTDIQTVTDLRDAHGELTDRGRAALAQLSRAVPAGAEMFLTTVPDASEATVQAVRDSAASVATGGDTTSFVSSADAAAEAIEAANPAADGPAEVERFVAYRNAVADAQLSDEQERARKLAEAEAERAAEYLRWLEEQSQIPPIVPTPLPTTSPTPVPTPEPTPTETPGPTPSPTGSPTPSVTPSPTSTDPALPPPVG